jgi:hypothetical protein
MIKNITVKENTKIKKKHFDRIINMKIKNISKRNQIKENKYKLFEMDWVYVSYHNTLTDSFIRKYHELLDWYILVEFKLLSEDILTEFAYKLNWNQVSKEQMLSENFIRRYKNKLNWDFISFTQN